MQLKGNVFLKIKRRSMNNMITPKEIEQKTMSPEKRKSAKNDYFAFYIGRPLTYVLTIPFLYTNISPNAVSYISFVPRIDGNIARYKKQFSKMGDTLDAAAGYFAMALIFFGAGIAATNDAACLLNNWFGSYPNVYTIFGGLSGMCTIMPRLIMHKAMTSIGSKDAGGMKDRTHYGVVKILALNITSVPGMVQILLLVCIFTHMLDLYTVAYFFINLAVMVISMRSIFKG